MIRLLKKMTVVYAFALIATVPIAVAQTLPRGAAELLMYEQRYVNRDLDTNRIIALHNYQAAEYSPENGQVFEVNSYWIPVSQVEVFHSTEPVAKLGVEFFREKGGIKQILMLIHPESEIFFSHLTREVERGPSFQATATASSRTLMMWPQGHPEKVFFGKLSLDKEIGGVVRTIPEGEVARSVGVSQILELSEHDLPEKFHYLPEFLGVMPKGMSRGGMILRSLPEQMRSGELRVMPLFALYTKPDPATPSPLEKMLTASGMEAKNLISQEILRPFSDQWVHLVVKNGIAIEAHAQNVLMGIRGVMPSGDFIYRDFGGFNIDLEFRNQKQKAMPLNLPVITNQFSDYHQEHHEKAIRQSLQTYFEGGFLFGLAKELQRLGHKQLNYAALIELLHSEIKQSFERQGMQGMKGQSDRRTFYADLLNAVRLERRKISRPKKCSEAI